MKPEDLPPPKGEAKPTHNCHRCLHWIGQYRFGVPLLCEIKHAGHDWANIPNCQNYQQKFD